MPSPRFQRTVSPSSSIDSTVVKGTPSWMITEAAEGEAVRKPMNSRAKLPPPISSPTSMMRQTGRGAGSSQGRVTAATRAKRTAAKNSGCTPQWATTILETMLLNAQMKQIRISRPKSRRDMAVRIPARRRRAQ